MEGRGKEEVTTGYPFPRLNAPTQMNSFASLMSLSSHSSPTPWLQPPSNHDFLSSGFALYGMPYTWSPRPFLSPNSLT